MQNFSQEQSDAINAEVDVLMIDAAAGAGKTTTLEGFTSIRTNKQTLNVCFNKSVQLNADKKFKNHVKNKTSHALAFPKFGSLYADSGKLTSNIRPSDLSQFIDGSLMPQVAAYSFAAAIINTINVFIASADKEIDKKHAIGNQPSEHYDDEQLVKTARIFWQKMVDTNDRFPMVHDGYLKLWALSKPKFYRTDLLLVDEYQDTTPALIKVFESQQMQKVMVGDPHQSIYQFRHAVDAMKITPYDLRLPLTTSYRFGQKIAYLANMLLYTFKGETKRIKGFLPEDNIGYINKDKPYAVIAKTNIGLFDQAVEAVQNGKKIHYVGGIAGYSLDSFVDAYYLRVGQKHSIRDEFIRKFDSYEQLQEYAQASEDAQIQKLIKITENYSHRLPDLVNRIKMANVSVLNLQPLTNDIEHQYAAHVFLTTVHKSKGLEFNQVILAEDFAPLVDEDQYASPQDLRDEDINGLYVALTRAKHTLQMNQQLKDFVVVFKAKRAQQQSAKVANA